MKIDARIYLYHVFQVVTTVNILANIPPPSQGKQGRNKLFLLFGVIQKVRNAKIVHFVDPPTPCNAFLLFYNNRRTIDITISTKTHPPPKRYVLFEWPLLAVKTREEIRILTKMEVIVSNTLMVYVLMGVEGVEHRQFSTFVNFDRLDKDWKKSCSDFS